MRGMHMQSIGELFDSFNKYFNIVMPWARYLASGYGRGVEIVTGYPVSEHPYFYQWYVYAYRRIYAEDTKYRRGPKFIKKVPEKLISKVRELLDNITDIAQNVTSCKRLGNYELEYDTALSFTSFQVATVIATLEDVVAFDEEDMRRKVVDRLRVEIEEQRNYDERKVLDGCLLYLSLETLYEGERAIGRPHGRNMVGRLALGDRVNDLGNYSDEKYDKYYKGWLMLWHNIFAGINALHIYPSDDHLEGVIFSLPWKREKKQTEVPLARRIPGRMFFLELSSLGLVLRLIMRQLREKGYDLGNALHDLLHDLLRLYCIYNSHLLELKDFALKYGEVDIDMTAKHFAEHLPKEFASTEFRLLRSEEVGRELESHRRILIDDVVIYLVYNIGNAKQEDLELMYKDGRLKLAERRTQ